MHQQLTGPDTWVAPALLSQSAPKQQSLSVRPRFTNAILAAAPCFCNPAWRRWWVWPGNGGHRASVSYNKAILAHDTSPAPYLLATVSS